MKLISMVALAALNILSLFPCYFVLPFLDWTQLVSVAGRSGRTLSSSAWAKASEGLVVFLGS